MYVFPPFKMKRSVHAFTNIHKHTFFNLQWSVSKNTNPQYANFEDSNWQSKYLLSVSVIHSHKVSLQRNRCSKNKVLIIFLNIFSALIEVGLQFSAFRPYEYSKCFYCGQHTAIPICGHYYYNSINNSSYINWTRNIPFQTFKNCIL